MDVDGVVLRCQKESVRNDGEMNYVDVRGHCSLIYLTRETGLWFLP